jgi:hypothetical protein
MNAINNIANIANIANIVLLLDIEIKKHFKLISSKGIK